MLAELGALGDYPAATASLARDGHLGASRRVCAGVLMWLWWRCFGPGRSLGLVLGGGRLGGQLGGGGAGRRLSGWVGSEGEAGYRAEGGERGRGEQDVVEPAGGAGAGGVGDRGAGGGRDRGGCPGAGAGGNAWNAAARSERGIIRASSGHIALDNFCRPYACFTHVSIRVLATTTAAPSPAGLPAKVTGRGHGTAAVGHSRAGQPSVDRVARTDGHLLHRQIEPSCRRAGGKTGLSEPV